MSKNVHENGNNSKKKQENALTYLNTEREKSSGKILSRRKSTLSLKQLKKSSWGKGIPQLS